MPDRPRSLKLGGQVWRVRYREIDDGSEVYVYGMTTPKRALIEISPSAALTQQRDTVLHEVLHAVLSGVPHDLSNEAQEQLLRMITPPLLAVLVDNPELISFLTGGSHA